MKIIQGNILDITSGVICHQVNCRRVAGAGLALQMRHKFPGWYENFQETTPILGNVTFFSVNQNLTIANLYAQSGYGINKRQTDYIALRSCLITLREERLRGKSKGQVYIPYRIGCGLAGGDWDVVKLILEDWIPNAIIVQLK